jgi:hypothetical protein
LFVHNFEFSFRKYKNISANIKCFIASSYYMSAINVDMKAIMPWEQNKECRICYECDNEEEMMFPFICSKSLEFVHISCLTCWMQISGNYICSVCKSQYIGVQYSNKVLLCNSYAKIRMPSDNVFADYS